MNLLGGGSGIDQQAFSTQRRVQTSLVSTNDDGLRASGIDRDNTDSKHRIMTLGCSTTFGWGVSNEETYPSRLQHYIDLCWNS